MRTTNNTILKIAVLAAGVQDIGGGAASPALADIRDAMPAVFFGQLVHVCKKKTLLKVLGQVEGKPSFALSAAGYAILIVIVVVVTLFSPKATADRRLKSLELHEK